MSRDDPAPDDQSLITDETDADGPLSRRSYLALAGASAAAIGTGVSTGAATEGTDGPELIRIDYDEYADPNDAYAVNDNRSGIPPEFTASPTDPDDRVLRTEFSSNQKTANVEYRFEEHGYGMPGEVYTRFDVYPENVRLGANDTVRMFWLPLTNGTGSSGGGATNGTNGWSNAIGFAHRNGSPAPDGYNFFSYSYHMDGGSGGDFEMTDAPIWMDEWNEIEGYVRCNTFSGGSANADGVMRYWVNGELAYERENLRFTTTSDNRIGGVGPLGYVVGSNLSGAALLYDNHEIAVGGMPDDDAREADEPPYDEDPHLVEPDAREQYDERFTFRNGEEETSYRLYVDGEIVQSDWSQATYNDTVDVTEGEYAVVDAVASPGTVDGYFFDGEIVAIAADAEPAGLWISGEEIDIDDYPDAPADDDPLEHTLLIDGVGTSGGTAYEFSVTGGIEQSTYRGASIDDDVVVEDGRVAGSVGGWRDAFRFGGDLEDLSVDGPARLFLDGDRIDPAEYGVEQSTTLTIVGNGTETRYEAIVSGTIDRIAGDVDPDESSVTATIERGYHQFAFSGELVSFAFLAGGTHVYLDDERIDPDL